MFSFSRLKSYVALKKLLAFLKQLHMRPVYFAIPVFFSIATSIFEGISIGLLVPFLKGALQMNFSFAREYPILRNILEWFPPTLANRNIAIFATFVVIIFIAAILKNVFWYLSQISASHQIRKFVHELRCLLFNRYLSFGKLFFDRESVAHITQVLEGNTNTIGTVLYQSNFVINLLFMVVVYVVMMFYLSWQISLCVLISFPFFNGIIQWLINKIKRASESQIQFKTLLNKKMYAIISCISLVKANSQEEKEKENYRRLSSDFKKIDFNMTIKQALIQPLMEILTLVITLVLISGMAYLLVRKIGHLENYLVYFFILRRGLMAMTGIKTLQSNLAMLVGPINEIKDVLKDNDKYYVTEGLDEFGGLQDSIAFEHLNFFYSKDVSVLHDVSLTIKKGEMTAIVGPTGSGKTTIINLIMRFYECPPGSIFIDGTDIRDFKISSLREKMILVSQDIQLFNDTLRSNILFGLDRPVADDELWEMAKRAQIFDLIKSLPKQFDSVIGDRGFQLSGGEKQRIALMRAMLKNAEILILDEATSAMDLATEKQIRLAIEEAKKGRTTIAIAHRLSTIQCADKIIVVENGRIVEEGKLNRLIEKKKSFQKYWREQSF